MKYKNDEKFPTFGDTVIDNIIKWSIFHIYATTIIFILLLGIIQGCITSYIISSIPGLTDDIYKYAIIINIAITGAILILIVMTPACDKFYDKKNYRYYIQRSGYYNDSYTYYQMMYNTTHNLNKYNYEYGKDYKGWLVFKRLKL